METLCLKNFLIDTGFSGTRGKLICEKKTLNKKSCVRLTLTEKNFLDNR